MKSVLISLVLVWPLVAWSQPYSADWWSVDAGGISSVGGAYTLSASTGQHESGTMTGGAYTLIGGFWAAIDPAVSTSTELILKALFVSPGTILISWPASQSGCVLQQTSNLDGPAVQWSTVAVTPVSNHGEFQVMIGFDPDATEFGRFFRLQKP